MARPVVFWLIHRPRFRNFGLLHCPMGYGVGRDLVPTLGLGNHRDRTLVNGLAIATQDLVSPAFFNMVVSHPLLLG